MKRILFVFLFIASAVISKAQNNAPDGQAIHMLKEFYTAYCTIPFIPKNIHKIDSLQTRYCTIKLRKELKGLYKETGLGHDVLTNDEGTDLEHLKTLKIIKDTSKANAYIVSYIDHTLSAANKPIDKTVVIHVTVAKENGRFKIADAYGDAISLR